MTDFIVNPGQLTSVLDAANQLIGTLGEAPLDTLEDASGEAQNALNTLALMDRLVQARGWSWNRLYGFLLPLSPDGSIPIPDQTMEVVKAYIALGGSNPQDPPKVTFRDGKLWDNYGNTAIFKQPLYADLIVRQPWEGIPEVFRIWITLRAAQRFHASMQERGILLQVNQRDVQDAMVVCEQREDEAQQFNTVTGNLGTASKLYGTGGLRRNRQGIPS